MKGFQPNTNFNHLPVSIINPQCTSRASQNSPLQVFPNELLNKRTFQDHGDSFADDLNKKIKIAQDNLAKSYNALTTPLKLSDISSTYTPGPLLAASGLQEQLLKAFLHQQTQALPINQYLNLFSGLNKSTSNMPWLNQKAGSLDFLLSTQARKEELHSQLKTDMCDDESAESQPETTHVTEKDFGGEEEFSEVSVQEKREQKPRRVIDMRRAEGLPALAEYTLQFPDWDLTTIFDFLKSGKSMEVYENERKTRTSKKSNSAKQKKAPKVVKKL